MSSSLPPHRNGASAVYGTSLLKRRARRTQSQMDSMLAAIQNILAGEEGQITIRHLFYRLVGQYVIPKTEVAYKSLCRHLSKWRRSGDIEYSAFADSTRWHIQDQTFDSMEEALANTVATYRRNLWATQPFYCEVWVEKDAMAAIVSETANGFGVPVFVARGFASLSSLYGAANTFKTWRAAGKACFIYHLGDYDPSGVAAGESIRKAFADDFKVHVQLIRIAVTRQQIQDLSLPTRPVKMSDSRAARWTGGECVELDSMPPGEIRRLVETSITNLIDVRSWETLQQTERMEKETLARLKIRRPRA